MELNPALAKIGLVTVLLLASATAEANVVGNDTQNFNPVAGSTDFVTVESSATLVPGHMNVGLFVNDAANTLPYQQDQNQNHTRINDSLLGMDVGAGVGIAPGLEFGVALPFVLQQSVSDDQTRGEFAQNGNTAVRAALKYAVIRGGTFGLALVGSANIDRVQDDPHTGESNATIYNAEIAGDVRLGRLTLGLNLGYRTRQEAAQIPGSLVAPVRDEALASAALSYKLTPRLSLVTEVFGARPLAGAANDTDRSNSSAEAIAGLRYAFTPLVLGHVGAGSQLMKGLSTPDWRIYAGVVTEFGPGESSGRTIAHKHRTAKEPAAPAAEQAPPTNDEALAMVPKGAPDEVFILHDINFEYDSDYRVLPGAFTELNKLAQHLAAHPYDKIVVEGHCDFLGSDEYNDDLSTRRARTVRRQLIKHQNLEADKIIAVGYGKRVPLVDDPSDYGRQQNRRVEIKIYRSDVGH